MQEAKLDLRERKLLYELDVDARQSYSDLAKKLRISKQLVKYKVERLEKLGVIEGYYTMIDTSKLGYTTFRIYVKFRNINHSKKKEMVEYLKGQNAIFAIAELSGRWDLAFLFNVKEIYEFYTYWDSILEKYLEFILDYKIAIYSPIYHYSKSYLIGKQDISPVRILGGNRKEPADETDLSILKSMAENARIPIIRLAELLNKSPEGISYRIKALEKNKIIIGYRSLINLSLLGFLTYKVDFRLRKMSEMKRILAYSHLKQNIYQVNKTIGGETLEIEFQVRSLEELKKCIDGLESEFPDTFEYYDYYIIYKEIKVKFLPEA
jgi:DNA-binding Lrp family transcriptional regulator